MLIDVPSPADGRPLKYQEVADQLRRRIAAGVYPPGAPLPAEPALMAEFSVSRGTVREAIGQLRNEGLVITEQGRGSHVRPNLPVRRRGSLRYREDLDAALAGTPAEPSTSFTRDQGIAWDAYELEKTYSQVPADAVLADLLGLPEGRQLLRRRFVFRSHGHVQQMSTTYMPLAMVRGTPIMDPDREPWPGGTLAQLLSIGVRVTGVREVVRGRVATRDEADVLGVGVTSQVQVVTRQMYADERVVEAAEVVIPADRVELEYWIPLD